MSNFRKTAQRLLSIWGGISLIGFILLLSYLAYFVTLENRPKIDKATKSDIRFVLNWCILGDKRIEKVVKSYTSGRGLTGDHFDAYSIKITHVSIDELEKEDIIMRRWYRCDSLPKIVDDATTFIKGFQEETPWFPEDEMLRTKDYYVYPVNIGYQGTSPYSAQLIFIKPKDKIIYYIDAKM